MLSARRDAVVLAVLITAVLLLIWNGSTFFNHIRIQGASFATDVRIASTALTLNVALILFGWRRYVDLQHEAEIRNEQERRAALLATTDHTTGLYNRKGFADRAAQLSQEAAARGDNVVIISFQIQRFKTVNDQHGYEAGDWLLKSLATALRSELGPEVVIARLSGDEFAGLLAVFAPEGRPPRVGEVWRNPEAARTLRLIAETQAEAFYRGEIAERIVDFAARTGGFLTADDLARHTSDWVEPITTSYRGYDVWEMPPSTQGLAALLALNILEGYELSAFSRDSVESFHRQLEAMKLAFADVHHFVADPAYATVPVKELLSKSYAARRRALIGEEALLAEVGDPRGSDTTYLCAADSDGMMVSFIQSTYHGFGAHIVAPGTGFPLQNRGNGFSLAEGHANCLAPGKRPFHTLIPGFLTHAGKAVGPFGVMGGHMQPQGHVQMMVNTLDYAMDPQSSLETPRWSWQRDRIITLEPGAAALAAELAARGHVVEIDEDVGWAGRGQIIWRLSDETGGYVAGSEPRADGQAAGY